MARAATVGKGHLLASGCFVLLAAFRAIDHDIWWSLLFLTVAIVEGVLAWRTCSRNQGRTEKTASDRRSWLALAAGCSAATVVVALLAPALSLIGAMLLVYCTWRALRAPVCDFRH